MQRDLFLGKNRHRDFRYGDPLVQRLFSRETSQYLLDRNPSAGAGEVDAEVRTFLETHHPVTAAEPYDPSSLRNELQYHRALNSIEREIQRRHDAYKDRRRTATTQRWYVKDIKRYPEEDDFGATEEAPSCDQRPAWDTLHRASRSQGLNANYTKAVDKVWQEDTRRMNMQPLDQEPLKYRPGMARVPTRSTIHVSQHRGDLVNVLPSTTRQPIWQQMDRNELIVP